MGIFPATFPPHQPKYTNPFYLTITKRIEGGGQEKVNELPCLEYQNIGKASKKRDSLHRTVAFTIFTGVRGRSFESVLTLPILSTTSIPSMTFPKTGWLAFR